MQGERRKRPYAVRLRVPLPPPPCGVCVRCRARSACSALAPGCTRAPAAPLPLAPLAAWRGAVAAARTHSQQAPLVSPRATRRGGYIRVHKQLKKLLVQSLALMKVRGACLPACRVLRAHAPVCPGRPGVVFSYALSAITAMLTALCYAEYAAELPVAGGAFNYVSMTFGEYAAW